MTPLSSVLFVCTGNACRSQMAEAILRHMGGRRFRALSAGSRPAGFVHPLALQALKQLGIPSDGLSSKHVADFIGNRIDICITVCDSASAECPSWPAGTVQAHWALPDPTFYDGTEEQRLEFCCTVAQRLLKKISRMSQLPIEALSADALADRLAALADL